MEKIKKLLVPKILIPVAIGLALLIAYIAGCVYFSSRFLPNTIINDRLYGGKSLEYVENDIERPLVTEITLHGKENEKEVVSLTDVECKEVISFTELEAVKKAQKPFLWFTEFFREKKHDLDFTIDYKEDKLDEIIGSLSMVCGENIVQPQNADIVLGQSTYEVVPAVMGNALDIGVLKENIVSSIISKDSIIDLQETGIYLMPEILEDSPEIEDVMAKLNPITTMVLTYDFKDRQEVLDYDTLAGWVSFGEDKTLKIDEDKAKKYIESLAAKYDTLQTTRKFVTSHGTEISIGGGIYGWQTNIAKSTQDLIEHIKQGETKTIEPAYTTYGLERGIDDIGNTYVEIDLTNQHMWFYKNGSLFVDTGVVTGLPGTWRETPTGVFSVWSKETKRYLSGDDYKLWVEYWLPINWTGVGIHDATWQPTFGGDAYLYRGSHGCINTPREICGQIFNNIEVATPVVIYK